jgi:cell division protein FtsI (penicillin-binding protein 3)
MNPPGAGAPPVDLPGKNAPWNSPEFMPRDRSRATPAARPPRSATGRGATASKSRSARTKESRSARTTESRSARTDEPRPIRRIDSRPNRSTGRSASVVRGPVVTRPAEIRPSSGRGAAFDNEFGRSFLDGGAGVVSTIIGVIADSMRAVWVRPSERPRAVNPGSRVKVANHRRRILIVLSVFVVLFAIVIGQVVKLQVLDRAKYVAYGESQRTSTQVLAADRGAILDRNGAQMVISQPARSVFVDPKLVTDAPAEAAQLAPLLGLDPNLVQSKMTDKGRFAYLARKVPTDTADRIAALGLAGVSFLDETERYLPAGDSARSLLGGVDVDNVGISGLETQYGAALTGTPGRLSLEKSPSGSTIAVGDHSLTPALKGDDLKLTIDRSIQFEAERLLADQVKATGAKGGVAIVSKPGTGEVLAIANVATDPDTGEVHVSSNNTALTTQYEPGSVMKTFTVAGAMDAGQVEPSTQFYLPPTLKFYDDEFGEAEGRGAVTWDVSQILTNSSNIGAIKIAQGLGKEKLYEAQKAFGFGSTTELAFPNEAPGAVLAPSKYTGTSLPSIAIGQGISVTPMQLLFAYNAIANKGVYIAPKLVDSTIDAHGVEHPTPVGESHRAVSETTADKLNLMLRGVVQTGTGQLAAINGYSVAGKTGTARKPQPGGGYTDKYGAMKYQSTFVGMVPAEQPALSVYVMIDEPTVGDYTGGATAAPVFSKLGSFALNRLGIAPAATDASLGGAPVNGVLGAPTPSSQAIVTDGDRVRALTAGSAAALAASVPSTIPPAPTTTTTIRRTGTTG